MPDSPWPLEKIQGFLLRGYTMSFVRHFALTVADPDKARAFIGSLVDGASPFQITSAEHWGPVKPDYCLNIGFTYRGLGALGMSDRTLSSFQKPDHQPFVNGSAAQATFVGDVGPSAPSNWIVSDSDFDVMFSLFVNDIDLLKDKSAALEQAYLAGFGVVPDERKFDSQALDDDKVYFDYRDNIAQPIIENSPFSREPDGGQDLIDPGSVMLGTATGDFYNSVPVPQPQSFGHYGGFGAFRVLRQDVEGFEQQIADLAPAFGAAFQITNQEVQRQALKAKICGRWPNGTPLSMFPVQGNALPPSLPPQKINDFLFTLPDGTPDMGSNCPIGSHIRRGNMRLSDPNTVTPSFPGAPLRRHRVIRRAMPYQLPYMEKDRNNPNTERGLSGFFLSASLMEQFEFVQHNWINNSAGFYIVTDPADPLMGVHAPPPDSFETIPTSTAKPGKYNKVKPMAGFVITRASAYVFFPGIDGIRLVAAQT